MPWKTWLKKSSLLSKGTNPVPGKPELGEGLPSSSVTSSSWSKRDSKEEEGKEEGEGPPKEGFVLDGVAEKGGLWLGRLREGLPRLCCELSLAFDDGT